MKKLINITSYLLIVAGGSFAAWATYNISAESFVALEANVSLGFPLHPKIEITSPESGVVSEPVIQVVGYLPTEIESITYEITNAAGINQGQADWQNKGYVTGQFFNQAKLDRMTPEMFKTRFKPWTPDPGKTRLEPAKSALTTNFFQLYNVNLAQGKNRITIHMWDKRGNRYTTRRFYTLDYASAKTLRALTATREKTMVAAR